MNPQGSTRVGQLPPRFKELMQGCRQMARSLLAPLYVSMLDNSDVALLEFAEKAESNAAQAKFFEAMQEFKRKRIELEQAFFKAVDAGFRDFINGVAKEGGDSSGLDGLDLTRLSLVDKGEVEETLPVQNMVAKANANYSEQLYGLTQRLAVVNGGGKLDDKALPGGPAQLAYAARDAFRELNMDGKTRMVIYAVFERYVMRELANYYDEYNRRLVNAGILKNLRYEIRKMVDPRQVGASASKQSAQESRAQTAAHTDMTVGEETFAAIRELLAMRHPRVTAATAGVTSAVGDAVPEAIAATSRISILGAINTIQTEHGAAESSQRFQEEIIENVALDRDLLERIKVTLVDERQRLYGGVDRRKVASADSDVIDLVGMLFEFMLQDDQLPNVAKALLSRLHTPYLKVAIIDKHLFTEKQHPARRLLDMLAEAGTRWISEEDLERGVFPCMRRIVDRVLTEFKDDMQLFDELLTDLSTHLSEVEQKVEVIEKRAVEAADGQARLQYARNRAREEIDVRLERTHLVPDAQTFMRQVWLEKLTFILLRERDGEQSEVWQLALQMADRIVWSLDPKADAIERGEVQDALPTLRAFIREGLESLRAYGRRDNDKLFDMLCEWQDHALADPEADIAAAEQAQAEQTDQDDEPVKPVEAPTLSSEEERMLENLGTLEFDTWFEFSETGGVRKHRWKLAWYSKISSNYMFVDAVGVKAAELTRQELARQLCTGQARILHLEAKPFLDRALESILGWLGKNKTEAVT